jgi:hypothetical protein
MHYYYVALIHSFILSVKVLCLFVCVEKSPLADKLIETIIQPDVVPSSVEFLAMDHRPQLQVSNLSILLSF